MQGLRGRGGGVKCEGLIHLGGTAEPGRHFEQQFHSEGRDEGPTSQGYWLRGRVDLRGEGRVRPLVQPAILQMRKLRPSMWWVSILDQAMVPVLLKLVL